MVKEHDPGGCHLLGEYYEGILKEQHKATQLWKDNCEQRNFPASCFKWGKVLFNGLRWLPNYFWKSKVDFVQLNQSHWEVAVILTNFGSCYRKYIFLKHSINTNLFAGAKGDQPELPPDARRAYQAFSRGCDGDFAPACCYKGLMDKQGVDGWYMIISMLVVIFIKL